MSSRHGHSVRARSGAGSVRRTHVARLVDVLHLCLGRGDVQRANRAFAVVCRCAEADPASLWHLGQLLVSPDCRADASRDRKRYLKELQSLRPHLSPAVLLAYVLCLVTEGDVDGAVAELDLYLPTPPYALDPGLHESAGLFALLAAQTQMAPEQGQDSDEEADEAAGDAFLAALRPLARTAMYSKAKQYFERARSLDREARLANRYLTFMGRIAELS